MAANPFLSPPHPNSVLADPFIKQIHGKERGRGERIKILQNYPELPHSLLLPPPSQPTPFPGAPKRGRAFYTSLPARAVPSLSRRAASAVAIGTAPSLLPRPFRVFRGFLDGGAPSAGGEGGEFVSTITATIRVILVGGGHSLGRVRR